MMASSVNLSAGAVASANSLTALQQAALDVKAYYSMLFHTLGSDASQLVHHPLNTLWGDVKSAGIGIWDLQKFQFDMQRTAVDKVFGLQENPELARRNSSRISALHGLWSSPQENKFAMLGALGANAFEGALTGGLGELAGGVGLFGEGGESQAALRLRVLGNIAETRAGINVTNFGVHAAVEKVPFLDISTHADEATFWSGKGNRQLAESFADLLVKRTIEMTSGGKYLESLNLFTKFSYEQARVPWERLSERFARNASGEVYAFVTGSTPGSVFRTVELPALIENPDVTN